jgi:hypothetical protein
LSVCGAQMAAPRFMLTLFFDEISVETMLTIWDVLFDASHPVNIHCCGNSGEAEEKAGRVERRRRDIRSSASPTLHEPSEHAPSEHATPVVYPGSLALIYASLALFEAVSPDLRADALGDDGSEMLYSVACAAFRRVTAAEFTEALSTVMLAMPPVELARMRVEVRKDIG